MDRSARRRRGRPGGCTAGSRARGRRAWWMSSTELRQAPRTRWRRRRPPAPARRGRCVGSLRTSGLTVHDAAAVGADVDPAEDPRVAGDAAEPRAVLVLVVVDA